MNFPKPLFDFYASQAVCGGLQSDSATMSCLRNASISALARAQDAGANLYGVNVHFLAESVH